MLQHLQPVDKEVLLVLFGRLVLHIVGLRVQISAVIVVAVAAVNAVQTLIMLKLLSVVAVGVAAGSLILVVGEGARCVQNFLESIVLMENL